MSRSNIDYAKEYEQCEAENLRQTGLVQANFVVIAVDDDGRISTTEDGTPPDPARLEELRVAAPVRRIGPIHDEILDDDGVHWLRHRRGSTTIFERPTSPIKHAPIDEPDWDQLVVKSRGNLWKLSFALCELAEAATGADRSMIYRFHDDWSGEIIAEKVKKDLEPFLGLHYPPTDIPSQARALFEETRSRHLFTTTRTPRALRTASGDSSEVDLTHALSRSISPYHIEYLRNMGSASTASCALMYEGKLWGLLSLHFTKERTASIEEFQFLQTVSTEFEALLTSVLDTEREDQTRRAQRMTERFSASLDEGSEPLGTMMLSPCAIHRMIGGQGAVLTAGKDICCVGSTPSMDITDALCAFANPLVNEFETLYLDRFPSEIPIEGRAGLAGCAITKICNDPETFIVVYRSELNQSVTWGGDPRRTNENDENMRVSPRASFEKWVERVEGQSARWTDLQKLMLQNALAELRRFFDMSPRETALLIRNGLRQAVRRRDYVRNSAVDIIDGIKTAIAVGVERAGTKSSQIVALNGAASDAFAVANAEAVGLSIEELEKLIGVDLSSSSDTQFTTSVTTATNGIRECEVSIGLLFGYTNRDKPEDAIRLQVFEFRDVTEAKRIEDALTAARDRAIVDAKLRSEFYAKLSHELKTPLNAMIGLSSVLLIRQQAAADEETLKHLGMIKTASVHMAELVESTLDNAAAIQNIDEASFASVSVKELVDEALTFLRRLTDENGLTVEVEIGADTMLYGEPRAIRQILLNIISNAAKYNVQNGMITIRSSEEADGFVAITIEDTGNGMTPEQIEECMTPYQRFAGGDGSGLGLSIASHLSAVMSGVLTLDSQLGVGTSVRLLLPGASRAGKDSAGKRKTSKINAA